MKFANPIWLWGLWLIPVLYFVLRAWVQRRAKNFEKFISASLWKSVVPEFDPRLRLRRIGVWLLALGCILLALARPQMGLHEETQKVTGLDLMLVLDISNSMEVEDVVPNRLKKAKHALKNLIDGLRGDRVGVVAFAGSSFLASPLTTDLDYVLDLLQTLETKAIANQGTDIGIALDTAARALFRASEEGAALEGESKDEAGTKVVLLITDGEDMEEKAPAAAQSLSKDQIRFFVLGVGSEKGGPVPERDENGVLVGYKRQSGGSPAVSAMQPQALAALAQAGGGKYWTLSDAESEVDELLKDLGMLDRTDGYEKKFMVYQDYFQVPLALAFLLLLFELSLAARKSGVIAAVFAGVVFLTGLPSAEAARPEDPAFNVYLQNKKGIEAYQSGNKDEAIQRFGSAQASDPLRPELLYNQGLMQLELKDYASAQKALEQAAQSATQKEQPKTAGYSYYNLGEAEQKEGKNTEAIKSWVKAIEQAQLAQDRELEAHARKRIELLAKEQQQKQQEQKQGDSEQKDPKKEQDKKPGDPQDQKDPQGNEEQKDKQNRDGKEEPKKYQEKHQKDFKSQALTKEDAEKVMAELANREKQLQAKMRQKKKNQPPQTQKKGHDW